MREKLMYLISDVVELYNSEYEELADHLIANGVVISNLETTTEVVRCKDCKHSEPCGESRQCLHPNGLNVCDGNDFCSYGERREDNG